MLRISLGLIFSCMMKSEKQTVAFREGAEGRELNLIMGK